MAFPRFSKKSMPPQAGLAKEEELVIFSRATRRVIQTALICFFLASPLHAAPVVDAVLAELGYGPDAYEVMLTWQEAAPSRGETLVYGVRLAPVDDGELPFDLYYDATGAVLDADTLAAWGVQRKDWAWKALYKSGEPASAQKSATPAPMMKSTLQNVPQWDVGAPDVAQALAEDEANELTPAKGPVRIGLLQEIAPAIDVAFQDSSSEGVWTQLADGAWLWSVILSSPDAVGIRVRLTQAQLPAGAFVAVYNADNPQESYGPLRPEEALWTPTCFGDRMLIECVVPAKATLEARTPLFSIDSLLHQYRSLDSLSKQAGFCNLDVACYPEWEETAKAVGGITYISDGAAGWCTGTLLADEVTDTVVPFFLTANHCVDTTQEAATVEVFWLYGTDACDGAEPDRATVPRTIGGADLRVSSTSTDVTLLQLREEPPAGLSYAGFTTAYPDLGTDVTGIHHPNGDFKRICFGVITDDGSPFEGQRLQPVSRYHEVLWDSDGGVTEGGSSGSALFVSDAEGAFIVGQLWGGRASCFAKQEPDYYGRFDVSYPLLQSWLKGQIPDEGEGEGENEGEGEGEAEGEEKTAFLGCAASESGQLGFSGFMPSLVCFLVACALISFFLKSPATREEQ
jgi:hypothetical protein